MIFCIGGGTSLKGFDFNRLDKYVTIGCNHIGLIYKESKNLVFLDNNFYAENKESIEKYKGHIYCHSRAVPEGELISNNVTFIESHYKELFINDENIYIGMVSGLTALDIACHKALEYNDKEIYLLGYDLYGGHFYQDLLPEESRDKLIWEEPVLNPIRIASKFTLFHKYMDEYGIKIFNCSLESRIKSFNFVGIEEVLKGI